MSSDMCRFMKATKGRSGLQASRRTGRRLWQDGYDDHVLTGGETTEKVIAYILANPVRAGLVSRMEDYPFMGSARYTLEELIEMVQMRGRVDC